jgi:hypothetical protein
VEKRKRLSPVLLGLGDAARCIPLECADGYHRLCESYYTEEDGDIPCRMVDLPAGTGGAR